MCEIIESRNSSISKQIATLARNLDIQNEGNDIYGHMSYAPQLILNPTNNDCWVADQIARGSAVSEALPGKDAPFVLPE